MVTHKPDHGGRVELKFARAEPSQVVYAISLTTKSGAWSGLASIGVPEGGIEFRELEAEPPVWLVEVARTQLRALHRSHREGGTWPRRLTRWRPDPEAG